MSVPSNSWLMSLFALFVLMLSVPSAAQAQQVGYFPMRVSADSVNVRSAPSTDSATVASVFALDALTAVGRNVDGTWVEVARPAGWIRRDNVTFTFDALLLPLTDFTTGVLGSTQIIDTGFDLQTIDEAPLRAVPERSAQALATIPLFAILPALERTPDNQWIAVNYRGTVGWLPEFLTRPGFALTDLPIANAYANDPSFPAVISIPRERQIAQVERLLAYIAPLQSFADGVANYWGGLQSGEVLACQPPYTEVIPYYSITPDDLVELPELRQQIRLLSQAVDDLNAALVPTNLCGVVVYFDFGDAYSHAVNALASMRLVEQRMRALLTRLGVTP